MNGLWVPGTPDFNVVHSDPYEIALGSDPGNYGRDYMRPYNVIVNLTNSAGEHTDPHTIVMHYSMRDVEEHAALPDQDRMDTFLSAVHAFAHIGPSYWHCQAGLNRSAFFLAAYLRQYRGFSIHEAMKLLREKRDPEYVLSNDLFAETLVERYA